MSTASPARFIYTVEDMEIHGKRIRAEEREAAARQVTLNRNALALAMVGHEPTLPSHCTIDCVRSIAEKYERLLAGDKAEAPPKRERIDWKNVVVDEGDEATW